MGNRRKVPGFVSFRCEQFAIPRKARLSEISSIIWPTDRIMLDLNRCFGNWRFRVDFLRGSIDSLGRVGTAWLRLLHPLWPHCWTATMSNGYAQEPVGDRLCRPRRSRGVSASVLKFGLRVRAFAATDRASPCFFRRHCTIGFLTIAEGRYEHGAGVMLREMCLNGIGGEIALCRSTAR